MKQQKKKDRPAGKTNSAGGTRSGKKADPGEGYIKRKDDAGAGKSTGKGRTVRPGTGETISTGWKGKAPASREKVKSRVKPGGFPGSAEVRPASDHPFKKFRKEKPASYARRFGEKHAGEEQKSRSVAAKDHKAPREIRLNRYIANSGVCSRREADDYILSGQVTVNDVVVRELGTKVTRSDTVRLRGKKLNPEKKVYVLLNKPKDYISTVDDPYAKRTVMDLVRNCCRERIYPVGRLDRQTTGLILFTNDGELTKKLTHPSHKVAKIYQVGVDKPLERAHLEKIAGGIELEDGPIQVDEISYVDPADKSQVGVQIHSGRNRIIRRIFEHFDYKVVKLDRVFFAGLTKKNLPRGKWRFLNEKEVNRLKMNIFK